MWRERKSKWKRKCQFEVVEASKCFHVDICMCSRCLNSRYSITTLGSLHLYLPCGRGAAWRPDYLIPYFCSAHFCDTHSKLIPQIGLHLLLDMSCAGTYIWDHKYIIITSWNKCRKLVWCLRMTYQPSKILILNDLKTM